MNNQSTDTVMQLVGPFCETSNISSGMKVKSEEIGVKSILLGVDTISNGSVQKHRENNSIRDAEVKVFPFLLGAFSRVTMMEGEAFM